MQNSYNLFLNVTSCNNKATICGIQKVIMSKTRIFIIAISIVKLFVMKLYHNNKRKDANV
jgi:hypothetical protein